MRQTYTDLELIIVNDSSPDSSAVVLEHYRNKDPRVVVLTNPSNLGVATSCNVGLRKMRGEYFCILDQDDLWKSEKAARQIEFLERYPEIGAVYSKVELVDTDGESLGERKLPDPKTGDLFIPFLKNLEAAPIVSCMFRSSLLARIGYFATIQGNEDFDFLLRVASVTPFGFVPEILVALRCRPDSFSHREIMVFDQFRLADLLESRWPKHRRLVRRYRSQAHYNTAHYLANAKRVAEARHHFLRAALCRPSFLRAWFWWINASLPEAVSKRLPLRLRLSPGKYQPRFNLIKER